MLLSAKQSYNKTVAENRELKAYIENLKQHIQQQQVQFLEKQRNYHQEKTTPKKYKKVVYQEETESEPEFEEEEVESESKQIEKEPEIKKSTIKKKRGKK